MIQFDNVGLRYEVGPTILRDVHFSIPEHSFQFLTGASGAGKTSLLKLICLLIRPTRGLIKIFGQDTSLLSLKQRMALRRRMGIIFQDNQLLSHLTAYENVLLPLLIKGQDETSHRHEIFELLAFVGLHDKSKLYPSMLSGGEQQRLALARALVTRPQILIADEPTGNVDPPLAKRLLQLFIELNSFGTTIIISTHDIMLMNQTSYRRLVLFDQQLEIYD